jgi:hypothetical protein
MGDSRSTGVTRHGQTWLRFKVYLTIWLELDNHILFDTTFSIPLLA